MFALLVQMTRMWMSHHFEVIWTLLGAETEA